MKSNLWEKQFQVRCISIFFSAKCISQGRMLSFSSPAHQPSEAIKKEILLKDFYRSCDMFFMVTGFHRSTKDSLSGSEQFLEWKVFGNPKPAFLEFSTVRLSGSP